MKQLNFVPLPPKSRRREHGGTLLLGKRRTRRPLNIKCPHHLVLRSDFAYGRRALVRHRPLIDRIIEKAKKRFDVRVYKVGIEYNHIHLAAKGSTREGLQNFFRMVAGHIAQEILREIPIKPHEKPAVTGIDLDRRIVTPPAGGAPNSKAATHKVTARIKPLKTREKENKFWQTRIYSRIVSWGREFIAVKNYVMQNHLEGLGLIPRRKRKPRRINCTSHAPTGGTSARGKTTSRSDAPSVATRTKARNKKPDLDTS